VNIIKLLENKPSSRRAVIQLFNAEDIAEEHLEIPCTCTLQFMIRDGQLYLFTSMRSNDAFWGLPHDIFAFTMLQEIVARSLSVELGTYSHFVGSLHLYEKRKLEAKQYLEEGLQSTNILMENMPKEDPWPAIHSLLKAELIIRSGDDLILSDFNLSSYWLDLIRL
ncbi:MAG: thymidylate synthase, partial [candidate division Zixibacteria bacterium]|nr:thymidylate synthase [candidate division Zixibacteria bacterium]NIW42598.1 thymidylate synthase [candidate division Zixibacteria bacterium]NIX58774.1 thymidylate synthase [candidate division Zixibacteria bacterium]